MTTCIWDGQSTLYADTLSVGGHMNNKINKIKVINDYQTIILSGLTKHAYLLYRLLLKNGLWNLDNIALDTYDVKEENVSFQALLVNKTSCDSVQLYHFENTIKNFYEIPNQVVAIGSGTQYAMGAIGAGVTFAEAMHIAARYDENTGREFETYNVFTKESSVISPVYKQIIMENDGSMEPSFF